MPNKKRSNKPYQASLGMYRFSRKDILILEKIMKRYASVYDNKHLKQMPESEDKRRIKSQTRKFTDIHVSAGNLISAFYASGWLFTNTIMNSGCIYTADSVKFLPKQLGVVNFFELKCHPGITIKISPRRTILSNQRHYASGAELKTMNQTIAELTDFITSRPRARLFNSVAFRK